MCSRMIKCWNLLFSRLETSPINYVSAEIPSGSEMILNYQLLCTGKKWSCYKMKHKRCLRRPRHHIPIQAQTPNTGSHSLWNGGWSQVKKGTPQHCLASLAWRNSAPNSFKRVGSVVLQWAEVPVFFCWVLPETENSSQILFCITLLCC